MRFFYKSRGFTLVEMLVVVSILGVILSAVLFAVQAGKQKARDAQRMSDLQQIQIALRLFKDVHGRYPDASDTMGGLFCTHDTSFGEGGCLQTLVVQGSFNELPTDPQDTQLYYYDNGCFDTGFIVEESDQYRLWVNSETDQGSTEQNWPSDYVIGISTCEYPMYYP